MDEWYYLSTYHPDRSETEWRDLLKWQALPYAGYFCCLSGFLHSANAAVGMTYWRVIPFCSHRLYSKRGGRQGCRPYDYAGGQYRSTTQVVFGTWRAAGCRPYGYAGGRYRLTTQVVFETWRAAGCRPYGYAGRQYRSTAQVVFETWRAADLPPLRTRCEVILFIYTGCICDVLWR